MKHMIKYSEFSAAGLEDVDADYTLTDVADHNAQEFMAALHQARVDQGISQLALSMMIGQRNGEHRSGYGGQSKISEILNRRRGARMETVFRIAAALDCEVQLHPHDYTERTLEAMPEIDTLPTSYYSHYDDMFTG
ncbi:MAG TPA: helix-turn-helix transcriptional regulator [Candidatus Saccharimonadales bacterium]|nr:helix-turn-helix transcriptional regulator [Candidatus Saccharimonadales bacterium]